MGYINVQELYLRHASLQPYYILRSRKAAAVCRQEERKIQGIMFELEGRNNAVRDESNVQQLYFTVQSFLQLIHKTPRTPCTPSSVSTAQ